MQNNIGELAEKDQDVNYIIMSDPDVICTDRGLKDFTSTVIPEVDNRKALMPPSILAIPPPLPPKRRQRPPTYEKTLNQNPQVKMFNKENKPLDSLACQMSPVLSGVKENNECLDLVPEGVPDMHNYYAYGILPKVGPKCLPQLIPRPPPIPPIKPPRPNKPQRAEAEEGNQRRKQEEEWRRHTREIEDQRNKEDQDLSERNEKMKQNEETSGIESHLDVGIPPRQTLNLLIDKEKGGEEGKDRGREESSSIGLNTMTENSSLLLMECSDLIPDKEPDMVANNRNCTSTETLKWTKNKPEIQISGQSGKDSGVISKLPSGHWEGTEVVGTKLDPCQLEPQRLEDTQETAERLLDGEPKLTSKSTKARQKVKKIAKKVMGRLKEKREEKRRIKLEMEMHKVRDNHIDVTQDERRHGEEEGEEEEEEEEEEGTYEDAMDHADLVEKRVKRKNATSDSPFSSFKVCGPVKLVEELLSGEEWSQFLYRDQSSTPDPPPYQTHSEDTAQLSVNFQSYSSAELVQALNVFEGKPAVPEEEPVYEDVSPSYIITGKSQTHEQQEMNRTPITAVPKILLESETSQMSLRTKDVYDTVEFIQPVHTCVYFSDIKSQGVLDSSIQKYLIKLSKKRKHRARKRHHDRNHAENLGQSPSSTSPQQVFSSSIFYNIPASGGEEEQQLSTAKSGGSSPRSLAKIKTVLKLGAAQPKEDRGK